MIAEEEHLEWEWQESTLRNASCVRLMAGPDMLCRMDGGGLTDVAPVLSLLTEIPDVRRLLEDCRVAVAPTSPQLASYIATMLERLRTDRPFTKEEFFIEFARRAGFDFAEVHGVAEVYTWLDMGDTAADAVSEYISKYGIDDLAAPWGV